MREHRFIVHNLLQIFTTLMQYSVLYVLSNNGSYSRYQIEIDFLIKMLNLVDSYINDGRGQVVEYFVFLIIQY
jgi:hypothetical protein